MEKQTRSKIIMHLDGDAFFAGCEIALNPHLRGKPVVIGMEKSIATAISYEAKALGIVRGSTIFDIKKNFPQVIILPSNYIVYSLFSDRMCNIVRRFSNNVEKYSIDECFAEIPFENCDDFAKNIQKTIEKELGLTVSVGLGKTKVIAKLASKFQKPNGFTNFINNKEYLNTPIGKVWGIGQSTRENLYGINTVSDFISRDRNWINSQNKNVRDTWYELQGIKVNPVIGNEESQKSISSSRTFKKPSTDKNKIWSELVYNIEVACRRMHQQGFASERAHFFIKTNEFQYVSSECIFINPLFQPLDIVRAIKPYFDKMFKKANYRASGITLGNFSPVDMKQNLFSNETKLWDTVYALERKFGTNIVQLASSVKQKPVERFLYILSLGKCK